MVKPVHTYFSGVSGFQDILFHSSKRVAVFSRQVSASEKPNVCQSQPDSSIAKPGLAVSTGLNYLETCYTIGLRSRNTGHYSILVKRGRGGKRSDILIKS